MQPVIKIGLTYTGNDEKHGYYSQWLKAAENIDIVKLCEADDNIEEVKKVDAIVLSGGIDTHPKNYGSSNTHYPNAPSSFNEKRDLFETEVFESSQRLRLPALCICRGMQLVNCILGGDLLQDNGPAVNQIHRNEGMDKKHEVRIIAGTLLQQITKVSNDWVNTAHHQSIRHLGKGLTVNAYSTDGIIEGVEWMDKKDKPFFLGVQWHPERMFKLAMESSPLSKSIRDFFINEIINSKKVQ